MPTRTRIFTKRNIVPKTYQSNDTAKENPHVFKIYKHRRIVPTKYQVKSKGNVWNEDHKKEKARIFRVVKTPW